MDITWLDIINKTIIVGLTYVDNNNELIKEELFHGKIINADAAKGICLSVDGKNDTYCIPPDLTSLQIAPPGEYKLQSTGEVILNPDLISNWIIKMNI